MNRKYRVPKLPRINVRIFIAMLLIIILLSILVKCIPKFISGGDIEVGFIILENDEIPSKIQEILPRYKMLERALAAKIEDQVYVIVTRGEKLTGGYKVEIDKIILVKEEDESKLVVYAIFQDPKPDELVPQVITYPYVLAKTDLKELPKKIDLKVTYKE